ncbi:MAG: DMT family transporter [Firmicutes bacterium]|nr:DMT family transporter [Bacillota bacterium]
MVRGVLALVLATLLWSGNYVAGRVLATAMPALWLNGIRWTVSAVILWAILRVMRRSLPLRTHFRAFFLQGVLGMFLFSSLTYLGLHGVSAARAGMISGLIPVVILLLGLWILKERPRVWAMVGVVLSLVGVAFLFGGAFTQGQGLSIGDIELLVAAVCWAAYTVVGKRLGARLDPLTMTAGAAVYGGLLSDLVAVATNPSPHLHMTSAAWWSLLYVCTTSSVIAYLAWTYGVGRIGASRSAPLMNLLPVWTVIAGLVLLHEQLSGQEFIGGLIIIAGAVLAGTRRRQKVAS